MIDWRIAAACVSVCVLTSGCSVKSESGERFTVSSDTVGVIPRVTSSGTPGQWTLQLHATIGSLDDGPSSFGRIRSVLLDGESNIFVADVVGRRIVVFDSSGTYLRTIGRTGGGPGEFEHPYSLAWLGDDLLVLDWGNARIGRFSKTGDWLGMWRWQPLTGEQIQLSNGSVSDVYAPFLWEGNLGYLHLTPTGIADTMTGSPRPYDAPTGPVCRYPGGAGIEFFGIPFGPKLHVSGGPDGSLFAGWSASYQVAHVNSQGDTLRLIRRLRDPVAILDAEWEEGTERYRNVKSEHPGTECDPDDQPRPAHKPAFRWFGVDVEGRLWVEAYADDGFTFEVFDPSGRLIGSMAAPDRHSPVPPYVGRDWLAVITRDWLDVHYVEVYKVVEGQG